jgi:hypothetical protein
MSAEQKKLPFEPIFDILNLGPDEEKGGKMTRQVKTGRGA